MNRPSPIAAQPAYWPPSLAALAPALVAFVAFAVTFAASARVLGDPDTLLHVAVGRWILAHGAVPSEDVFSYSAAGSPWVVHEWASEVVLAALYDAFGWAGLVAATASCFAATMAILARALTRRLAVEHALIGVAFAAGLCYAHLLARPHVLAWPLLVAWTVLMGRAKDEGRAPAPYAALVMLAWANLHGGFVVGLGLLGFFAAEAIFEASDGPAAKKAALHWGAFAILALAASLATPNGIAGWLLPFHLLRMDFALSTILEWRSVDFQSPQPLEPWLMLVLFGAFTLGLRLPVTRLALLLVLLHMALQHQRNAELLGFVSPLIAAPALAPQLRALATDKGGGRLAARIAAIGLLVIGLGFAVYDLGWARVAPPPAPRSAMEYVKAQGIDGPVFNDANFGDYLIFLGVAPFVDGRADLYGDAFLRRYAAVGEFPALAREYKFAWAILAPRNAHVALIEALTDWRRVYADAEAIVYVRATGGG